MNIPYHVSALHLIYKMVESNEKREGKAFIFTHNEELYATPWQEKIKCYYIFFCPSYPKVSQNGLQLIWKYSTRREFGLRIRIQRWLWRRWKIWRWRSIRILKWSIGSLTESGLWWKNQSFRALHFRGRLSGR